MTDEPSIRPQEQQLAMTIAAIPCGRVATYGQLAELAGLPGYARHVGHVLHKFSASMSLPWHRVVRANGSIALQGAGLAEQIELLGNEGVTVNNDRVDLRIYQWQASAQQGL